MSKSKETRSSTIPDEQIIDLYFDRDENAIVQTDAKYGNMLFLIAYNILSDPLDSEECKNDAYLGIWNAIPPTRPTMFSAFISKIVRNISSNRYKEKMRQKRIPSELTISIEELQGMFLSTNDLEADYEAKEVGKIISDYVRGLTERQQFIFMEKFYLLKTIERISKESGIASTTIHREITKIKEGLKAHLERNGVYL